MENYIIYDHVSPSGKHYIGQTSRDPKYRWANGKGYLNKYPDGKYHQPLFARAILKYGWDNFQHNILFTGLSQEEANAKEIELITKYKEDNKSYNIAAGGESHHLYSPEEAKEAQRLSSKKYWESHRDEINARNKAWRDSHKEEVKAYNKAYRDSQKEKINTKWREWWAAHRDEINAKRREQYKLKKQYDEQ